MSSNRFSALIGLFAGFALAGTASAATYAIQGTDTVLGEIQTVTAKYEDTFLELGRRYGVGYEEIVAANPGVDPWLPGEGTQVVIPSRYILPEAPREGIIVSLAEHRLYYFPKVKGDETPTVITYPISVGKMDWKTPLGLTRITDKRTKPIWYPPESVRKEHAADGRPLPKAVPAGPDNPLGNYAMRLGIPGGAYLIHGTNNPAGVGMQVTHGCIRMYPEDIEQFFKMVAVSTPVRIVHQPYKMGWKGQELYMEVHAPLQGQEEVGELHSLTQITRLLVSATQDRTVAIDWARAEQAFNSATGIPEPVMLGAATSQLVDTP
ncbi:L,D-transpeptidase ErfK/SrfK [Povalibacter uvarum]|uniref:L,D-transpeptidase ErfK/SrfK n=1 Tax=Povalibacter uvarum TaxID=732238 RepID=A0A841HGD6_9GAMM|nr:L,D-transpeptidase family protein [Povalibacter uvarum]MBB6091836.1 L,D-transpeptidase ErfK/SrfK [Povalibacter uvarum]